MSAAEPALAMAAKEHELQAAGARIVLLRARLAKVASRREELADVLGEGEDGLPLAMSPLTAALVGAVAANAALFFGYVVYLTRFREPVWNAVFVLALLLGGGSLPVSSRHGAGGRARLGLRRFTMAGLAIAVAVIVRAIARR